MASIGYLPRRFRGIGKYPILATSTSVNNCYLLLCEYGRIKRKAANNKFLNDHMMVWVKFF